MSLETYMQPLLAGKRIVVTGAASGIGLGSARLFRRWGATVSVSDNGAEALCDNWSDKEAALVHVGDIANEEDCRALIGAAAKAMGGIDGVFHCAGISDVVAPALDLSIDDWQRGIDVNLRGTFLICREAGRHMLGQGGGSIVTMSSINGINGIPRRHSYGPAKAGVAQLTRTLACEWGRCAVRVNALAPTYIESPMVERLSLEGKIDVGQLDRRTPLGRIGTVDDVARAAAYLLSDWSDYITGIVLPVDGGWLAYGGAGDVAAA